MNNKYPYKCLNILGNELRFKIITLLQTQPMNVQEICEKTKQEQSKISHSLSQLRHCNFIDFKQNGKERKYFVKSEIFSVNKTNKPIFELVEEHAKKYCE